MTESEIMKALECCKKDDCDNCTNDFGNCYANLAGYAIDLLNRKNAEIEAEKTYYSSCLKKLEKERLRTEKLKKNLKFVRGTVERQKAEIEILSKNADTAFQDGLNEAQDLYREEIKAEVRAEAIKEFAEKIYRSCAMYGQKDKFNKMVFLNIVDETKKEMGCGE